MRLIAAAFIVLVVTLTFAISGQSQTTSAQPLDGQAIFRYDTFGDEQLWTDVLRMHEVIPAISPATALAVGLKVDVQALPHAVIAALQAGQVDLNNPAVTIELVRLNAVVGVRGTVNHSGQLTTHSRRVLATASMAGQTPT
jgi:hypothetical protein